MNNVITCLSDSYSVSRRETYENIVNYIIYFKQLEPRLQQLQNHLYGWYFKSLVTVVPLTDNFLVFYTNLKHFISILNLSYTKSKTDTF